MTEITSTMVKALREQTGAGMMDCKKALTEVAGDMEEAVNWLRTKGLAAAAKKTGRVASEGLIAIAATDKSAAMIELNSETDFLARNEQFQALATAVAQTALKNETTEVVALQNTSFDAQSATVSDEITRQIGVIGENINLRRCQYHAVNDGAVCTYIHTSIAPNMGKIGVIVALESTANGEKLQELGKKIAMHVAAAAPVALSEQDVDPELLVRERNILEEQARSSGRPADVIEKMIEGRIRKFLEEIVLLEQNFVMDGKTKIKDVLAEAEKELGQTIVLSAFGRYVLGEGIEKQEVDFAAEVQAQAGL